MASAVLADPTRALQGTNRGSRLAMEESENDVGSLEQLLLYADEHYLAGKLPLRDHLGKVQHGVEEYHQRRLHTRTRLSSVPITNRDSSLNTNFCQSVTFHIDLAWHHCRRSCRCSGVKGSALKGRLDLRFASARCLEIVCGTIATPTPARIVERVTVGSTSAYRTILRSSLLVVFLVVPDPVFRAWVPSRVHCSQQFLTAHSERSTWPATRRVDQPTVFIPMISPISNSCNVATPNGGQNLWWTRHPHVQLAAAAQPLFDPRGIEPRRPEDERERFFELTWEWWPTNPPLTKY
ncbi:uncharacterized protein TNCV_3870271 [Trichonephila clavipes]|nr:uncharacterized protein TNCV_3870271 [Trichonephila clavipes]